MRNQALAGLHGDISELALAAAAKVLGEGIDVSQHHQLIDKFLDDELGDLA